MKFLLTILLLCTIATGCAQHTTENKTNPTYKNVGGGCDGCEAIYETPIPFSKLHWLDTLPDFEELGPKLGVSGTVYQQDGKTPAADVVLYVYHTNQKGYYEARGNEGKWGRRNGYIRGWLKTNRQGQYQFYTLKPAPYPGRSDPAHIHVVVKEPDKNEYYIDEFVFDNDPLVTTTKQRKMENRGGSGMVHLHSKNDLLLATRNIVLGKNIPGYPIAQAAIEAGFDLLYVSR